MSEFALTIQDASLELDTDTYFTPAGVTRALIEVAPPPVDVADLSAGKGHIVAVLSGTGRHVRANEPRLPWLNSIIEQGANEVTGYSLEEWCSLCSGFDWGDRGTVQNPPGSLAPDHAALSIAAGFGYVAILAVISMLKRKRACELRAAGKLPDPSMYMLEPRIAFIDPITGQPTKGTGQQEWAWHVWQRGVRPTFGVLRWFDTVQPEAAAAVADHGEVDELPQGYDTPSMETP